MKRHNSLILLFAMPLLVPLLLLGVRAWQSNQTTNYDVGGFRSELIGERAAIRKLADIVAVGRDGGIIRIDWDVIKPALKPTSKRAKEIWLFGFFYDQQDKQLMHYTFSPRFTDPRQAEAAEYHEVTDVVIRSTADNHGTIHDLTRNGAKFIRRGDAMFDARQSLIFR